MEKITENQKIPLAVIAVPLPMQGHLNQLLHLSRRIAARGIPVHIAGAATHNRQARGRAHGFDPTSTPNVHFHDLPIPNFENPDPNPNAGDKFPIQVMPLLWAAGHLRQPVFDLADEISSTAEKIAVIYDGLMVHVVQDISSIPNAVSYCFHSVSAFAIFAYIWEESGKPALPAGAEILEEAGSTEGSFPPELLEFLAMTDKGRKFNSGEIFNTCRPIDGFYVDLLGEGEYTGTGNHWSVGPLYPVLEVFEKTRSRDHNSRDERLEWLEKQGLDSVVYVSFGTTSSLSDEQILEIAHGLEKSQCKFLWVLRDADRGDVFAGDVRRAPLPLGFETRVKGRGLIVRDWAPQLEILGHPSVGGFISHCGWNSCMESISMGVPIIAWPMHSDQPTNALLMTKVLGVGVQIKDWARREETVSSDMVEKAVTLLMASREGDEKRKRAVELGFAVREALKDGGVAAMEMDSLIAHMMK